MYPWVHDQPPDRTVSLLPYKREDAMLHGEHFMRTLIIQSIIAFVLALVLFGILVVITESAFAR